jgi:hypothetical protein
VIRELQQEGLLSKETPAVLVREIIFGTLEHTARGQSNTGKRVRARAAGQQMLDMLLGPVTEIPPRQHTAHLIAFPHGVGIDVVTEDLTISELSARPCACTERKHIKLPNMKSAMSWKPLAASCLRKVSAGLTTHVSILFSAPRANAHVPAHQLPAYWRIAGRNDTRSGRTLPRIGKNRQPHHAQHQQPGIHVEHTEAAARGKVATGGGRSRIDPGVA